MFSFPVLGAGIGTVAIFLMPFLFPAHAVSFDHEENKQTKSQTKPQFCSFILMLLIFLTILE